MDIPCYSRLLFLLVACYASEFKESTFSRQPICDVATRINLACSKATFGVRTELECLSQCNLQESCIGASVSSPATTCYLHETCPHLADCTLESTGHAYYSKNCEHGGTWNWRRNACDCVGGWTGGRCLHLPKSCDDLILSGYATGPHEVTLDLSHKGLPQTGVLCRIQATPPTFSLVVLMTNKGRTNLNKNWASYRDGYEVNVDHSWLGLDTWRTLGLAGYTTMTIKASFYMAGKKDFYRHYYNFTLADEAGRFAFTFDASTNETVGAGTDYELGDCLEGLQNVGFSTYDSDSDAVPGKNCANWVSAGWWYGTNCTVPCNLLGFNYGYRNLVVPENLIRLAGIDMTDEGENLLSIEMSLKTPLNP